MGETFNTFEEEQGVDLQRNMYLTFLLDNRVFAFPIKDVNEIVEVMEATPVPEYPTYVKGIVNIKGRVTPVIDLRLRFKIDEKEYDERTCIIVLSIKGENIGFIVDTVLSVMEITEDIIDPPPSLEPEGVEKYILGVAKIDEKLIMLLDSNKIIKKNDFEQIIEKV